MSLNPRVTFDGTYYWLQWDSDGGYAYDLDVGGKRTISVAAVPFNLGTSKPAAMPSVASAHLGAYEVAADQTTPFLTMSIKSGQVLSGKVSWTVTPRSSVPRVEFYIDGQLKWTESYAPYVFNGDGNTLDTSTLTNGTHTLTAVTVAGSASVNVTVNNIAAPPPPTGSRAGRVGAMPDMGGGWLDASSKNSADRPFWLTNYDHVLAYGSFGSDYVTPWYPRAFDYIDCYAIYTGSVGTLDPLILRDSTGKRVYIDFDCKNGVCPQYAADVGNQVWRDEMLRRSKDALAHGYQGIYYDDVNLAFRFSNGTNAVVPIDPRTKAPMTPDNWNRYMVEMLEYLRANLPGVPIVHNSIWFAGPNHDGADQWSQRQFKAANIITYERGFNDSGLTTGTGEWSFDRYMKHMDNVHKAGANIWTLSRASTLKDALFNLACTLLVSKGGDFHASHYALAPPTLDPIYKSDLGDELGPRATTGTNIVERSFTKGHVKVDFGARTGTITVT